MSTRPMIDGEFAPGAPLGPEPEPEPVDRGVVDVDRPIPTREGGFALGANPVELGEGGIPSRPEGVPPIPNTGMPLDQVARLNAQHRARVMSALVMHFGGEASGMLGPDELGPVADRFLEVAYEFPQLFGMLDDELTTVLALSDDDMFRKSAIRGRLFPESGPIMDAIAEVMYESGSEAAYQKYLTARADTMKGEYENLLNETGDELRDTVTRLYGSPGLGGDGDEVKAQSFTNALMHQPGMWVVDPATNRLLVSVQDRHGEQRDFEVQLDRGVRVNNTLDALTELIRAKQGTANTMVRDADLDGPSPIGLAFDSLTKFFNSTGDSPEGARGTAAMASESAQPAWSGAVVDTTSEVDPVQITADVDAQLKHFDLDDDYLVGMVARALREGNLKTGGLSGSEALSFAQQLVEEDGEKLAADIKAETRDELIESALDAAEDRGSFGRSVDKSTKVVLEKMEAWDAFTNWLGVEVIEGVSQGAQGVAEAVNGNTDEMKAHFDKAFTAVRERPDDHLSEFFGMDPNDDWADVVDLAGSIIFDPTNLAFGGGKFTSKLAQHALTNPRYAPIMMRSRPIRALVNAVASENTDNAVRAVFSTRGLTADGYRAMLTHALDPQSTKEAVRATLKSQLPSTEGVGFFLGHGLDRAATVQTARGVGNTLANWTNLAPGARESFYDAFTVLARSRTVGLSDAEFLDDMFDVLVPMFVDEPDKMVRWGTELINSTEAHRPAELGSLIAQKQKARTSLNQSKFARTPFSLERIPAIDHNMTQVRDTLANLDTLVPDEGQRAAVTQQLEDTYRGLAHQKNALAAVDSELSGADRAARRQLNKVEGAEWNATRPETRAERVQVMYRMFDEIAEDLGLKPIPGAIHPTTGGVVYDWTPVTGAKMGTVQELELAFAPFGATEEELKGLKASGFLNRMASAPLPASPYEIAAYRLLSPLEHAGFMSAWRKMRAAGILRGLKTIWAFNLLFNPVSALRAHIDEPLRFLAETGDVRGTARALLPGRTTNPRAAQHERTFEMFGDRQGFDWVDNPKGRSGRRVFLNAADRWLNGSILNDDMFQHYAREMVTGKGRRLAAKGAYPAPSGEWVTWWNDVGSMNRRQSAIIRSGEKVAMDAPEAFNQIHRGFEFFLDNGVAPELRDELRDRILQEAVTPGGKLSRTKDARLLQSISRVPGVDPREQGMFRRAFDAMWGSPSRHRGGVFFEHFYDEAMSIYTEAYQRKGLLLSEDMLVKLGGVSPEDARWMLRQGTENPVVARLVTESGAVSPQMLEGQAARYAAQRADNLMYQMTASSLAGRGAENIVFGFPFLRAHVDFIGWWSKHLLTSPKVRLPAAARMVPGLGQAIGAVERVPFNVRAWAKWSHITSITNNDNETWVDSAIDDLTFFPTKWGGEVLADFIPTPGPLPSWMVDAYMTDEHAQEIVNTIWPNMSYTPAGASPDDFIDYALPASSRSLRRVGGAGWRFLSSLGWTGEENIPGLATGRNQIAEMLQAESMPSGGIDMIKAAFGDYLAENGTDSIPGSAEWQYDVDQLVTRELDRANRGEALSDASNVIIPVSKPWEQEHLTLKLFEGYMQESDLLIQAGIWDADDLVKVDPETGKPTKDGSGIPAVQWAWGEYKAGRLDADGRQALEDSLSDQFFGRANDIEVAKGVTLRDWLIFQHPELAANLASSTEMSDRAPREFARKYGGPDGRLRGIPPGATGAKIYKEAWQKGWIQHRDPEAMLSDAHARVFSANRNVITAAWENVTGLEWAHSTATYSSEGGRTTVLRDHRDKRVDWVKYAAEKGMFEKAGIPVDSSMTYQELYDVTKRVRNSWKYESEILMSKLDGSPTAGELYKHDDQFGAGLMDALKERTKEMEDAGYLYPTDWPDENRQMVRDAFETAINRGFIELSDYQRDMEYYFGPIDYEPPVPPPVDSKEITQAIRFSGKEVDAGDVAVLDGDTLSIVANDGIVAVRLIGINAPENTDPDYVEATKRLKALIDQAEEVRLVQWRADEFGATTTPSPTGEQRLLMWLYVDGVPIYSPTSFTADNQRGAATGGTLLDYQAIYNSGK